MSDPDLLDLVSEQKSAVYLALAAGVFVVMMAFLFRKLANHRAADPKVILKRIRWEIRSAREEFTQYPATHEIQEIVEGLGNCEKTIDSVVAKL